MTLDDLVKLAVETITKEVVKKGDEHSKGDSKKVMAKASWNP